MRGREVLVVEDNPQNLELVEFLLEEAGFTVRTARAADEMRQQLAEGLPDLVLMDIQLPGIDGITLVRELRADPTTHKLPILAITAHAMRGDRERFLEAGCDGYLAKPLDVATFARDVASHLAS